MSEMSEAIQDARIEMLNEIKGTLEKFTNKTSLAVTRVDWLLGVAEFHGTDHREICYYEFTSDMR